MLSEISDPVVFQAPEKASIRNEEEARKFRRMRWSVFLSATIGYGLYYVCRLSFNVVKKPLVSEGVFTESELGVIGSCLFFSYAVGKFVNGFLADRINIRKFMAAGLFVSALVNLLLGYTTAFYLFAVLWGIKGWVQSMGAPSCVVSLSRWYTNKERGSFYGFWSASHNIGEALTFLFIAFLATAFGWQWGFWGAGLIGLAGALLVWYCFYESPARRSGTEPDFAAPGRSVKVSRDPSIAQYQWSVVKNPYIWVLALSSAFMYISRYAINSWGIFYLEVEKGYSSLEASSIVSVSAVCGIVGTVLSGFVSDRLFGGSRNLPALLFGVLNAVSIGVFLFAPGHHLWVDLAAMVGFGLSIGALICFLGGMMAVDISSKKASGAALGVVGIASYIGAGVQDIISGRLIEQGKSLGGTVASYDFSTVSLFWLGSAVVSAVLALFVWNAKVKD